MSRFATQLGTLALMAASFTALPAHGLQFEQNGSVVTISGSVDYPDHGRLKDAVKAGAKYLVLGDIDGSRIDATSSFRRLISEQGMTTVIAHSCSSSCVLLFAGGKERYFAKGKVFTAYVAGTVKAGSKSPGNGTEAYSTLDAILSPAMPRDLLDKYTTSWDGAHKLGIRSPKPKAPEGSLSDCEASKCSPLNNGLSAVSIGFITSNQLFDLDSQQLVAAPQNK